MLTERQKKILNMIVEEFVKTNEPVGSKLLAERLDLSSATLRNEMAQLETFGYLEKTHTSSGRIPSEQGYHFYVESILNEKIGSEEVREFNLIDNIFKNKDIERDEAIKTAVNLLSEITNYTAIALGPNAYSQKVKKIELIPIKGNQCLVLIITDLGYVENKQFNFSDEVNIDEVIKVIDIMNDVLYGTPITRVSDRLKYIVDNQAIQEFIKYRDTIIEAFIEAFTRFSESKYFLSGQNNILYQPEFHDIKKVREFLTLLEKKEIFKLIGVDNEGISVRIGKENKIQALKDVTVITVPYEIRDGENGSISLVGPKRMEYAKVIPLVQYLAKNIEKLYNEDDDINKEE